MLNITGPIMEWTMRFSLIQKQKRTCRIMSLQSGKSLSLTKMDVKRIRKSFSKISNFDKWAEMLFLAMCDKKSNFKNAFGFEGVDLETIEKSAKLKFHSKHFGMFWKEIIESLRPDFDPETEVDLNNNLVVSKIRDLGRHHAENRLIRFDAETWLFFKNIIIDSVCESVSENVIVSDKTRLAWSKLLMFVVSEMKNAFNEGVCSRASSIEHLD